jgi:hypothetical protein
VDFFGVLHCVQDDGRSLKQQRQVQLQRQQQQHSNGKCNYNGDSKGKCNYNGKSVRNGD